MQYKKQLKVILAVFEGEINLNKILARMKKKAEVPIEIVGVDAQGNGRNIVFLADATDEEYQKSIMDDKISDADRVQIVDEMFNYFVNNIDSNFNLADTAIGEILELYFNGDSIISGYESIFNWEFIKNNYTTKKGEKWNQTKFKQNFNAKNTFVDYNGLHTLFYDIWDFKALETKGSGIHLSSYLVFQNDPHITKKLV